MSDDDDDDDDLADAPATVPAPEFTREQFLEWRSPRPGAANPEDMTNPVWAWLVEAGVNAWRANQQFDGPSALGAGPGWCFERFGRSTTELPDGRVVHVSGEHEDYYDPDFYIYNDVVVRHPDGRLQIFGYPREVFPPTDFHSATLVGQRLVLIGNLGYSGARQPGATQVLVLDLATIAIETVATGGTPPGWLHAHDAVLAEDGRSIVVQRGKLDRGPDEPSLVENIDDWRLHLGDWRWERLTERRWPRRELRRSDGRGNHLSQLRHACWSRSIGWEDHLRQQLEQLTEALGAAPDLDLAEQLYRPSAVPHELMPETDPDEYNVVRLAVDGVTVRYVDNGGSVHMTVEGELPAATIDALADDLQTKLAALEHTEWTQRPL